VTVLYFFYSIIFLSGSICQYSDNPSIHINVTHINSQKGNILVAVYNSEKGFPGKKEGAIRFASGQIKNENSSIIISDIAPGIYAIALFHDSNGDGKLNFNILGIPKEGYGFSNNARNLFSAPSFKQASFTHKQDTNLEIKMRY